MFSEIIIQKKFPRFFSPVDPGVDYFKFFFHPPMIPTLLKCGIFFIPVRHI